MRKWCLQGSQERAYAHLYDLPCRGWKGLISKKPYNIRGINQTFSFTICKEKDEHSHPHLGLEHISTSMSSVPEKGLD